MNWVVSVFSPPPPPPPPPNPLADARQLLLLLLSFCVATAGVLCLFFLQRKRRVRSLLGHSKRLHALEGILRRLHRTPHRELKTITSALLPVWQQLEHRREGTSEERVGTARIRSSAGTTAACARHSGRWPRRRWWRDEQRRQLQLPGRRGQG